MTYRTLAVCFSFGLGIVLAVTTPLTPGVLVAALCVVLVVGNFAAYIDHKLS